MTGDRPASDGRVLHLDQSARAARISERGTPQSHRLPEPGILQELVRSPYFLIERVVLHQTAVRLDPEGETFHVLTGIEADVAIEGESWKIERAVLASVVVPAERRSLYADRFRCRAAFFDSGGGRFRSPRFVEPAENQTIGRMT